MIFDGVFSARRTDSPSPRWYQPLAQLLRLPLAGVRVDNRVALNYAAVFGCIRIISESIAVMPWSALRLNGEMREVQTKHKVHRLLHRRPNPEMTPLVFKRTIVAHAVSWGNGYAEIERNIMGDPIALWIITPDRVTPTRDDAGKLVYEVRNADGSVTPVPARDMFHLPGLGFDGLQGYSVLTLARESIAFGMATEQFGAAFFGNGAQPGLVITQEGTVPKDQALSPAAVKNLLASFNRKNGGTANSGKAHFLDAGLKVEVVGIPQKDAQFLETRQFQILEICRWFRVPPHKLAELGRATFTNIESQNLDFVIDALLPWVTALEQEADFKLFKESEEDFYTKLNMNVFLRGDSETRTKYYTELFDRGVYCIDDILAMEDRNPLPGGVGKLRMVPMNFVSVEAAFKSGGTGVGPEKADQKTKALWRDPAQRMVNKEIKALERIGGKAGAVDELEKFYEAHCQHIAESFAAVAAFDGRDNTTAAAEEYCALSQALVSLAIENNALGQLLSEWRFRRADSLMQVMGCPHV